MKTDELPSWAQRYLQLRNSDTRYTEWTQDDPGRFSRVVYIAYPNGVYYVIDRLGNRGDGEPDWVELPDPIFRTKELAVSNAQKRAYEKDIPHRIREVVWNG